VIILNDHVCYALEVTNLVALLHVSGNVLGVLRNANPTRVKQYPLYCIEEFHNFQAIAFYMLSCLGRCFLHG
jgi:hypothetical protein